jgi:3-isopropylmalate/(R)-2-methylmalate dehydratase small subunit
LLTAQVDQDVIESLWALIESDPTAAITVDLEAREVRAEGVNAPFEIDDYVRWRLIEGLDDIGITLQSQEAIDAYEAARPAFKPVTTSHA